MSIFFPEEVPVLGNVKIALLAAVADFEAPDLSTEIGAGTTLDISCWVDGWNDDEQPSSGQSRRRNCSRVTLPREGVTAVQPIPLVYPYDPQGDAAAPGNELKELLVPGTKHAALVRKGKDFADPFVATDRTEGMNIRAGRQRLVPSDDTDQAGFVVMQNLYPLHEKIHGVVVA